MARMSIEAVGSSNEAADPYNNEDGTLGTQTRDEEKTSLGSETTWWPGIIGLVGQQSGSTHKRLRAPGTHAYSFYHYDF
jgi:hypothetical protein